MTKNSSQVCRGIQTTSTGNRAEQPRISISIKFEDLSQDVRLMEKYTGLKIEQPLFIDAVSGNN